MVVTSTPQGSTFEPMSDSAKDLAKMLRQEYGKTPITKPELVQTMDASKIIEGPSPSGTATQKKVANISIVGKKLQTLPVLSISEVLLSEFSNEEFKNVLTFKASSFISDQTRSSAHFEIKGVRAIWDPSLAIPGTNRRGGFRCPVGTRYGGQITDRFGRSCGWGVARRIANQIADIGERLEQRDDGKRKRRLDRRNARMIRRLGGVAETGRVEGGLRNIAERLDGGGTPRPTRTPVTDNRGVMDQMFSEVNPRSILGRVVNRDGRRQRQVPEADAPELDTPSVRVPRNRRRDVIPETAPAPKAPKRNLREEKEDREFLQRVLDGHPDGEPGPVWDDWIDITTADEPIIKRLVKKGLLRKKKNDTQAGGVPDPDRARYSLEVTTAGEAFLNGENNPASKPRPTKRPAPAARRPQPRPRVAPQAENVDVLTARDASDAQASEDFKPYVLRKYDEYAQRVREIREGGGNAGMLTRREWYAINKNNLRDAWKDAHGRSAPQDFEPPTPQARRPRNNRRRRRQATAQGAGRATTRKPTPDDVPEPAPARPVRPARRPRRQPVVGDTPTGAGGGMGGAGGPNANNEGNLENRSKRESGVLKIGEILGSDFDIDLPYEQKFGVNAPNNFPMARDRRGQVVWNPDVLRAFNLADLKIEELNLRDTHMAIYMQGNVYIVRKTDAKNAENVWRNNSQDGNMLGYRDMKLPIVEPNQGKTPKTPPQAPTPASVRKGEEKVINALNRAKDRHEKRLPKLANGKFDEVPVGNKNIRTKAQALAYQ